MSSVPERALPPSREPPVRQQSRWHHWRPTSLAVSGAQDTTLPRWLRLPLMVLTPAMSLLALAIFLIPTNGLLVGMALVKGVFKHQPTGLLFPFAGGSLVVAAGDGNLKLFLEDNLSEHVGDVRLSFACWLFFITFAAMLTEKHWTDSRLLEFAPLIMGLGSYFVKTGFHLIIACLPYLGWLGTNSFTSSYGRTPSSDWDFEHLDLGPQSQIGSSTSIIANVSLGASFAQLAVAWSLSRAYSKQQQRERELAAKLKLSNEEIMAKKLVSIESGETVAPDDDQGSLDDEKMNEEQEKAVNEEQAEEPAYEDDDAFLNGGLSPAYRMVPPSMIEGVEMHRVGPKRSVSTSMRIVPEEGRILLGESGKEEALDLENIRDVRFGKDRSIAVLYGGPARRLQTYHLIPKDEIHFNDAKSVFTLLSTKRNELLGGYEQIQKREKAWVKKLWAEADTNNDNQVDASEALELCKRLGIANTQHEVERHFSIVDEDGDGWLDRRGFAALLERLSRRLDIEHEFNLLSHGAATLSFADFSDFARERQHIDASESGLRELYARYTDGEEAMTLAGFATFLQSVDNPPTTDARGLMLMTRPLSEYYISSSHNTYLMGNQFTSESSVEGYVRALQHGCRCVEVDLWNGDDGDPVVTHGHTLTSRLPAKAVFEAISHFAFATSPYPVILSLENHLSVPQQSRLVEIMRTAFGGSLLEAPLDNVEGMPSPEELKYRVLVKTKHKDLAMNRTVSGEEAQSDDDGEEGPKSGRSISLFSWHSKPRSSSAPPTPRIAQSPIDPQLVPPSPFRQQSEPLRHGKPSPILSPVHGRSLGALTSEQARAATASLSVPNSPAATSPIRLGSPVQSLKRRLSNNSIKPKMAAELVKLLIYTIGVKYRGFADGIDYAPFHLCSLSESVAVKAVLRDGKELLRHCSTRLNRVYPSAARIDSSNLQPHHFWAKGMHLIAVNLQTYDIGAEMNAALFARNGGIGLVFRNLNPVSAPIKYVFNVKILSALRLRSASSTLEPARLPLPGTTDPRRNLRPSVSVAIYAPSDDCTTKPAALFQTAAVHGNAFNPIFDASFPLHFSASPEQLDLTFASFRVLDSARGDAIIGRFMVSLADLQPGFRHLPLFDHQGHELLFSSLFVCTSLYPAD